MEVKQRGSALGHRIILFLYKLVGYRLVAFILNFVALYYVLFTPSIKKSLRSYYTHQGIKLTYKAYFKHIKSFSLSLLDRFVSRINTKELSFTRHNLEVIDILQEGGVVLQSHVGSWAGAANSLGNRLPPMNVVMRENTKEGIQKVEHTSKRENEETVKIIDLSKGGIATNIQIANALINQELVAMMVDRVMVKKQAIKVKFFGTSVEINKNPFEIAKRLDKPLVAIFVMSTGLKTYDLSLHHIENDTLDNMANNYASVLEDIMRKHPNQWYNFYDFFKEV